MNSPWIKSMIPDLGSRLTYYNGTFPFLLSCKAQLKNKKYLSDKQWQAVNRCFYSKYSPK